MRTCPGIVAEVFIPPLAGGMPGPGPGARSAVPATACVGSWGGSSRCQPFCPSSLTTTQDQEGPMADTEGRIGSGGTFVRRHGVLTGIGA
jgi:hypothetical protein